MNKFNWLKKGQEGQILPIVLIALVLGSLLVVPTVRFAGTNIKAGNTVETNVEGKYAAEAGIEDAAWRLMNTTWPASFPYTYTLSPSPNGMNVSVTIDWIPELAGQGLDITDESDIGPHNSMFTLSDNASYDSGVYTYKLTIVKNVNTDNKTHMGKIGIDWMVMNFPAGITDYINGLPSGVVTQAGIQIAVLPTPVSSTTTSGAQLVLGWDAGTGILFDMDANNKAPVTYVITIRVHGLPGIDMDNVLFALHTRDNDVGTITDDWPFTITASASDSDGLQTTVRAGLDLGSKVSITSWEISP